MKSIGLVWLFWMGLLISVEAQITITNSVFPAVGDTLNYAIDAQPGNIVMTPPGVDQQWDFRNLRPSFTRQQIFLDARTGAGYGSFPSATMFYQTGTANVETYLKVSAQEVSLLGISGGDPIGLGLNLVSVFNPPIVQSRAPVQFFDIHQVSSGLLLPFSANILPDTILSRLPVRPDSLRIRVAINRLDVVDAWGTLSIPGGAYDVLREKRTEYRETRLDAKVPPLGWLDITDVAIQFLGLSTLGVDTTVSFHFLNDRSKEPIAVCTTDNSQLRVVSVQYKNLDISTGIKRVGQLAADLAVFPNPAEEVVHIRASGLPAGAYTLQIYTILGQEVIRKTCTSASGQLEEEVNTAHLERGVYVCQFSNGSGQVKSIRFVKQ